MNTMKLTIKISVRFLPEKRISINVEFSKYQTMVGNYFRAAQKGKHVFVPSIFTKQVVINVNGGEIAHGPKWNAHFILAVTRPWWTNPLRFFTQEAHGGVPPCSTRIRYSINDTHVAAINHLSSRVWSSSMLDDRRFATKCKSKLCCVARVELAG